MLVHIGSLQKLFHLTQIKEHCVTQPRFFHSLKCEKLWALGWTTACREKSLFSWLLP